MSALFFDAVCEVMEGRCTEGQVGAFLAGLTVERLTPPILSACARALRDHAVPVPLPPTLGDTIDIIPLARRPKAIDMTDDEAIIVNYDPEAAEFKRIAAKSLEKESHCMYGPSFLVFERSRGLFLEFFCGSKSSRSEAKKVYPYLPLSQADIDAKAAKGEEVGDLQPHGPLPLTLKKSASLNSQASVV